VPTNAVQVGTATYTCFVHIWARSQIRPRSVNIILRLNLNLGDSPRRK